MPSVFPLLLGVGLWVGYVVLLVIWRKHQAPLARIAVLEREVQALRVEAAQQRDHIARLDELVNQLNLLEQRTGGLINEVDRIRERGSQEYSEIMRLLQQRPRDWQEAVRRLQTIGSNRPLQEIYGEIEADMDHMRMEHSPETRPTAFDHILKDQLDGE